MDLAATFNSDRVPTALIWGVSAAILTLLAAAIGLRLQIDGTALFWPAAGIAAGLVLVTHGADRRGVVVGILLALAIGNATQGRSIATSLVFMSGNVAEALLLAHAPERLVKGSVRLDRWKNIVLLAAAVIDITERKEAADALQNRLAEIEALYDNAPIGLPQSTVFASERYAGRDEWSGPRRSHRTWGLVVPELRHVVEPVLLKVLETGNIAETEIVGESPNAPGVSRAGTRDTIPSDNPTAPSSRSARLSRTSPSASGRRSTRRFSSTSSIIA